MTMSEERVCPVQGCRLPEGHVPPHDIGARIPKQVKVDRAEEHSHAARLQAPEHPED